MYAIVDIQGQQIKVEKDQKIFINRLEGKEGSVVNFDQVLLIDNDKDVIIGLPVIKGALIKGKILSHLKNDKVKVFKKKRRKGYQVLKGHRQPLTEIQIEDILEKAASKPVIKKESEAKKKGIEQPVSVKKPELKEIPAKVKKTTQPKESSKDLKKIPKKESPQAKTAKKDITKTTRVKPKTTPKASSGTTKTSKGKTQRTTVKTKKTPIVKESKTSTSGSIKKKPEVSENKSGNTSSKE